MLLCLYLNASWTGSMSLPVNHLLLLRPNSLTGLRRQTGDLGLALVSLCVCGLGSKWTAHLLSGSLRLQPSSKNNIFCPWLQCCSIKIAHDCGTLPVFALELTSCTMHHLSQLPSEGNSGIFQDLVSIKADNHYSAIQWGKWRRKKDSLFPNIFKELSRGEKKTLYFRSLGQA